MTPPSGKPITQMVSGRRARRGKKYVVLVIVAVALVIGTGLAFAFAQPLPTGAVHPTPLSYVGVHEPDAPGSYTGVDQFAQGIGMQPNLVSYYSPWIEPFQVGFAISAMDRNAITLVQMDPTDVSLESIAAGEYDSYLRSYGTAVKAFAGQVILSFGHEMNGNWSSWGYQHTSPKAFVAAWQHIVTVFRTVGAMNVIWLWTVNVINNNLSTPIPDPAPWWPGSSYVNWVGIDGYYYNSSSTFSSLFGPTIVDVRRLTGDPILIAETGAEVSAGQPAKINDLFDGVRTYGLLGFVWFDENSEGRTWRIDSPAAFAALRRDSEAFLRSPAIPKSAVQDPSASGSSLWRPWPATEALMHILQLSDFYRPVIGGLERHVETLSHELVHLGHTVTVVTLQTGDDPTEETLDGVHVIRIRGWSGSLTAFHADAARPFHPTVPDPGAMAALRRVVQRERPDVVHSHSWLQYSYFPLHHGQRGPAHVVTLHDHGLACAKRTLQHVTRRPASFTESPPSDSLPIYLNKPCSGPQLVKCLACAPDQYGILKGAAVTTGLRVSRILHGRADRYIAISTAVADGSRCAVPSRSEIVIIPTMVPNHLRALARSTPRPEFLPPEDGYLMFVGALGRHKGVDVLLEARRKMRKRPPLVLIGTPRADTPRVDDPEVVIVRNVPSEQVMASWMRASVAVVPSVISEGMGQVAIEAMLVGRAVVASDIGGLREVVEHGVTGLMVPPGDPKVLAAALDSLLDDPKMRLRMGEAGRLRARNFEAGVVVPRVVEVFEDVLLRRADRRVARW